MAAAPRARSRGRPRNQSFIVEPATIMPIADLGKEEWTYETLWPLMAEQNTTIEFLARRGLLANSMPCPAADGAGDHNMSLAANASVTVGKAWRCRAHQLRKAIQAGSFFEGSSLPLRTIVFIMYYWASDIPQKHILRELSLSHSTVIDWLNFIREVCEADLKAHPQQIGGRDPVTGAARVVEIGETKYEKYRHGKKRSLSYKPGAPGTTEWWRPSHLVFGGVERGTGRCFLVEVLDLSAATLTPIIQAMVLPGTHIISDGGPAYDNLSQIPGANYTHNIVRGPHFVNPNDPNVHTRNIQDLLMRAKHYIKRQYGTSDELFRSYIMEFAWLQKNIDRETCYFGQLLSCIKEQYPL